MDRKKEKMLFAEFQTARLKVLRTPSFTLKYRNNGIGHNRFGIIVGSRVSKKATVRNLWKRRVREVLKDLPDGGKDFLFIASSSIVNSNFPILKREWGAARREIEQS